MSEKKLFILILLLCCMGSSFSQIGTETILYDSENDYIQSFPNHVTTRAFFVTTSNSFVFNDRHSTEALKLIPNKQDHLGASVAFKFLTLSYAFTPNFLSENQDNADSKLFNINFRTYFGNLMQSLDLYRQKGFFIDAFGVQIYEPDIKTFKIGGSTSYIFNGNLSFKAIVGQDERQLKNAGSFIPKISYFYTRYDLDSDTDGVFNSYDLTMSPAYFYNFVPIENLLISTGASAGLGVNHTSSKAESLTSLSTELNLRASITYDIADFYVGSHYNYAIINHNTDRSSYVKDDIPFFEVFLGYRFKAPKKWVGKVEHIESKLKKH